MNNYHWTATFKAIFDHAVTQYHQGNRDISTYFNSTQIKALAEIGAEPYEVYDFAEDHVKYGEPDWETILLITAARRDYFIHIQKCQRAPRKLKLDEFPAKDATVEGIAWLPRILAKARGKLRGELSAEIMFGCGGDRKFLKEHDLHPADFLRMVWAAENNDQKIINAIASRSKLPA